MTVPTATTIAAVALVPLIAAVAFANLQRPGYLAVFVLALISGACLAAYALSRTKFEPTSKGLFYVPHGPIGVSLAVLFLARLAYRLFEVYVLDPAASRSAAEFAQNPLTSSTFGLLAGWPAALVLISAPKVMPQVVRALGGVAALLFALTALQIFAGRLGLVGPRSRAQQVERRTIVLKRHSPSDREHSMRCV